MHLTWRENKQRVQSISACMPEFFDRISLKANERRKYILGKKKDKSG